MEGGDILKNIKDYNIIAITEIMNKEKLFYQKNWKNGEIFIDKSISRNINISKGSYLIFREVGGLDELKRFYIPYTDNKPLPFDFSKIGINELIHRGLIALHDFQKLSRQISLFDKETSLGNIWWGWTSLLTIIFDMK